MMSEPIVYSVIITLIIGGIGSIIEKVGMELENEKLMAVGKALESVAGDLPKLVTNIWKLFK